MFSGQLISTNVLFCLFKIIITAPVFISQVIKSAANPNYLPPQEARGNFEPKDITSDGIMWVLARGLEDTSVEKSNGVNIHLAKNGHHPPVNALP